MRIVCAPDSFKETLRSARICDIAKNVFSEAGVHFDAVPLADGGEGSLDALKHALATQTVSAKVHDPAGKLIFADFLLLGGGCAFIEMAAASGLEHVPLDQRVPLQFSTLGTGDLIREALDREVETIVVGVGGSATCDGGAGALHALGVEFLDIRGRPLRPAPADLANLDRIDITGLDPRVHQTEFLVASDVRNPLLGDQGAAKVFAPQKGAAPGDIAPLETTLAKLAACYEQTTEVDVRTMRGAGAAGGLAAGLAAICGARIVSGFDWIADRVGLESKMTEADWVITGEGRVDSQTFRGKTVAGVCALAQRAGLEIALIAGEICCSADELRRQGIAETCSLIELAGDRARAIRAPERYLRLGLERLTAQLLNQR